MVNWDGHIPVNTCIALAYSKEGQMFIKLNCSQDKTCFTSSMSYLWRMFLCTSNLVPIKTLKKKENKGTKLMEKRKKL